MSPHLDNFLCNLHHVKEIRTWYNSWGEGESFYPRIYFLIKNFDQIEKVAFEMYVQSEHKVSHEPSDFLQKLCFVYVCHNTMFYIHGRQIHQGLIFLLSYWKPLMPLFYCVSEESRHPCSLLETNRKLRVCFLGGKNKSTQGRIYRTSESGERNEKIGIIWSFSLDERSLPVIWLSCDGGVSSHALCGDLQTLYCRSRLFSAVTINHRMLWPSSNQKFW